MKNCVQKFLWAAIGLSCFVHHAAGTDNQPQVDWNRVERKARQAIHAHDEEYAKNEKQWTCIELRVNMFAEASLGAVFMRMEPERDHIVDNQRILEFRTLSVPMPFNLDSKEAHVLDGTYRRKEPVRVKKGARDRIHVLCTSAAIVNSRPIAELLVANGADIHAKDNIGGAPLHWAAAFNRTDIVRLLLNAGANPHLKDEGGDSPVDIARRLGHEDVLNAMSVVHDPGDGSVSR